MLPDGKLRPCEDNPQLGLDLEGLTGNWVLVHPEEAVTDETQTVIIFDGMAVVLELYFFKDKIKTCINLADEFIKLIENKMRKYSRSYVIFDDYSVQTS